MGNFDYLKEEKRFDTFSNVAIAAEKVLYRSWAMCDELQKSHGVCHKMDVFGGCFID